MTCPPIDFDPPPLVHDLSPSDESDELVMTPPQAGAGLAGFVPVSVPVSRSMPLQLPEAAMGRLRTLVKPDAPPAPLPVASPRFASYHAKGRHRSGEARIERRGGRGVHSRQIATKVASGASERDGASGRV
uniref:Exopolygalacturonase (ExoPG) (Poly(1,4-alpha-D-galacturonide)galacturonohydrolase)) n=1 Tax=Ganoderma boninense TaxID=34458 RepID=A0A5K1K8I8_9APHY|nr:Exopolygalacturonase (ExoPG) (EC (Galacturan 1,4-alpha-galacturonidase) (Poly(1,4-alpha-D-galacturonide)galacturonohydrolase) [Ganoderma boninense]